MVGFEFGSYTIREDDGFLNLAIVSTVVRQSLLQLRFYTENGTAMSESQLITSWYYVRVIN